ncbi:hypothetical protein RF11_04400 [Thelohanellus kitauei]|uniref:Uncharacterized protein n=1 Tax=Thelohanellus kitauei TaxID=669202 RepID=A0A0C2I6P0_THEKT|nr:hypothetical protein RF11_04400 [Thelohanellus kitauei]
MLSKNTKRKQNKLFQLQCFVCSEIVTFPYVGNAHMVCASQKIDQRFVDYPAKQSVSILITNFRSGSGIDCMEAKKWLVTEGNDKHHISIGIPWFKRRSPKLKDNRTPFFMAYQIS